MESPECRQPPSLKSQVFDSPLYILWIIVLTVFFSETAAIFVLNFLKPHLRSNPFLHSILLLVFLSPALYFFIYQPLLFRQSHRQDPQDLHEKDPEFIKTLQEQKMKEIEALANSVAHEVKNPLAIILQGAEYLKEKLKSGDENVSLILRYMGDAINRVDNVMVGLLEFSSFSKFDMQPADLNSVMEKALSLMQIEFDRYRIKVVRDLIEDLPPIKMDRKRMEQAFVNILLNAVQAMPGGGTLRVKTGLKACAENRRTVFIQIEDTGTGIPKESLERIFGLFFTTKRERGSSGLGLAVSSQIMRTHGGTIAIENRVGSPGARVTLTLPV